MTDKREIPADRDLFERARAQTISRKRALYRSLLGVDRLPDEASDEPDDEPSEGDLHEAARVLGRGRGRRRDATTHEARATGFDGGAREPAPKPPESHDAFLSRALVQRSHDRGARF